MIEVSIHENDCRHLGTVIRQLSVQVSICSKTDSNSLRGTEDKYKV